MINLNPNAVPKYHFIGPTNTPIIVIDDYALDSSSLVHHANVESDFQPDNVTGYPGIRAALPKPYVVATLKPLIKGFYKVYNIPSQLAPAPRDNYFSLITSQPNELSVMQTMPHFDNTNPYLIAIIHYLGEGEHGGIGFFQEKSSGLNKIEEEQKKGFYKRCKQYSFSQVDDSGYCNEESSFFTCYKSFEYKPNRLIAFPGYLLHSSLVDVDNDISDNPTKGRLTANMFVDFR